MRLPGRHIPPPLSRLGRATPCGRDSNSSRTAGWRLLRLVPLPDPAPSGRGCYAASTAAESPTSPFARAAEKPVRERGKIFNTLSDRSNKEAAASAEKAVPVAAGKKDAKAETNDDDDWGAVPAFLRRKK